MTPLLKALRSYAAMFNDSELRELENCLAQDFCYSSQMVFDEIKGKEGYLTYIKAKLLTMKESGIKVFAELAINGACSEPNCLVLAQESMDNVVATLLIEMRANLIKRADMCIVPSPKDVLRTRIYPKIGGN